MLLKEFTFADLKENMILYDQGSYGKIISLIDDNPYLAIAVQWDSGDISCHYFWNIDTFYIVKDDE